MPEDYIVCRIASMQFPGVYLQMDGNDVTSSDAGQGNLTIGHGAGPLDQFKISAKPTSGPYVTAFESVAYPGVFLRMDATELNRDPRSGGKVNKQFGQAYYELFTIKPQSDGTVAARKGIGINTQSDISAAVFNNKLYVVCKDYGSMDLKRSGLMWSILENPGENWKPSQNALKARSDLTLIIRLSDQLKKTSRQSAN
jgi:hypothetical protein